MTTASPPILAVRGTTGISMTYGPPLNETVKSFEKDLSKTCKCMKWSAHGDYFAWASGSKVTILRIADWTVVVVLDKPRVSDIEFSPKGGYLAIWQVYTTSAEVPDGTQNMTIYETSSGTLVGTFEAKKQVDWEPIWSSDETYCSRLYKNDVLFHLHPKLDVEHKYANQRVHKYSLSPATQNKFHVLCYIPGKQGQPSLAKLFQFPNFNAPIAMKSFFQADTVDMFWNKKGTGVLLQTAVEVDKTGNSYYGNQTLHFLSIKGDTSLVQLSKEGPIHDVAWSPLSNEFTVIYGFMPAKATIFNSKCEPVAELGSGPRNSIYYSPHGNMLLLGGFGNLQGNVEIWDTEKRKVVSKLKAPDTTLLEWSPQGTHFLVATTAPRLRVSNGFKIWHHSGSLVYERPWNQQEELWEVSWQKCRNGTFKTPPISYTPVEGIQSTVPQASKEVYRPPSARGKTITFKLNEEIDNAINSPQPSKALAKLHKKREAKKAAKAVTGENNVKPPSAPRNKEDDPWADFTSEDPDVMKKIKRIKSRLGEIRRTKEMQEAGKQLEANQLEKIKREAALLDEMKALCI